MITCILFPMREPNIGAIIGGIRSQTVASKIWIWDAYGKFKGVGEDVYFSCSENFSHRPRFLLAGMVETEFVFIQDDDFCLAEPMVFSKLIAMSRARPDHFLGHRGKVFGEWSDKQKPYQHSTGWCGEGEADMVNTGLSFFPARLMNKMPVNPYFEPGNLTKQEYNYGDDMYISKFQKCYATELLHKDGMTPLPECGVGVSHHGPHMEIRNALCRRYWGDKIK